MTSRAACHFWALPPFHLQLPIPMIHCHPKPNPRFTPTISAKLGPILLAGHYLKGKFYF